MKYDFVNVKNETIKRLFLEVLAEYPSLHEHKIILTRARLKSSTMRAQPVLSLRNFFSKRKAYKVTLGFHIRDREDLLIAKVPEAAIKGWFAHELGHVIDYKQFSSFKLLLYGIRYLISKKYRRNVEHTADYIAIRYGFTAEILETKKYILENDLIEDAYKEKISKYYLSIEDVHLCSEDRSLLDPYLHL